MWRLTIIERCFCNLTNIWLIDSPICKSIQKVHYGVAKHEEAKIECEVDADPADVVFHWGFNNTSDETLDVVSFVSEGRKSIGTYTPRVELDYGVLYCWARNSVGKQREPCVFFVIQAGNELNYLFMVLFKHLPLTDWLNVWFLLSGPPDPPDNCSVTNITVHTLTIECLPGYSGGLDQLYYLEVYSSNPNRLLNNITSKEYPFFIAHGLPAGYTFRLEIYSTNSKGRSRSVSITGSTLLASPWQSGNI